MTTKSLADEASDQDAARENGGPAFHSAKAMQSGEFGVALEDLRGGLARWRVAAWLGWRDALAPFRRTVIGPAWATFQVFIWALIIFALFRGVMSAGEPRYATYLAVGIVVFQFISNMMIDGAAAFTKASSLIQNFPNPLTIYLLRVFFKAGLLLLIQSPIIIGALIINAAYPEPMWLLVLPGIALLVFVLLGVSLTLASVTPMYRDIPFALSAVLRVMFFATPIIWVADVRGDVRAFASQYNPLAHFLAIVREPFLGNPPPVISFIVTFTFAVLFWAVGFFLFSRMRSLIASNL